MLGDLRIEHFAKDHKADIWRFYGWNEIIISKDSSGYRVLVNGYLRGTHYSIGQAIDYINKNERYC